MMPSCLSRISVCLVLFIAVCAGGYGRADTVDDGVSEFWASLQLWQTELDGTADAYAQQAEGRYISGTLRQTSPVPESYPDNYSFAGTSLSGLNRLGQNVISPDAPQLFVRLPDADVSSPYDYLQFALPARQGRNFLKRGNWANILQGINVDRETAYRQAQILSDLSYDLARQKAYMRELIALRKHASDDITQYEDARLLLCVDTVLNISKFRQNRDLTISGQNLLPKQFSSIPEAMEYCKKISNNRFETLRYAVLKRNVFGLFVDDWLYRAALRFPYQSNIAWDLFAYRWLYSIGIHRRKFNFPITTDFGYRQQDYSFAEFLMTITGTVIFRHFDSNVTDNLTGKDFDKVHSTDGSEFVLIPGTGVTANTINRLIYGKHHGQYQLRCAKVIGIANRLCPWVYAHIIDAPAPDAEKPESLVALINKDLDILLNINRDIARRKNISNRTYLPVMQILSIYHRLPEDQRKIEQRKLAEIIASEYALDFLEEAVGLVIQRVQDKTIKNLDVVQRWNRNLYQIAGQIRQHRHRLFQRQVFGLDYIRLASDQDLQNASNTPKNQVHEQVSNLLNNTIAYSR